MPPTRARRQPRFAPKRSAGDGRLGPACGNGNVVTAHSIRVLLSGRRARPRVQVLRAEQRRQTWAVSPRGRFFIFRVARIHLPVPYYEAMREATLLSKSRNRSRRLPAAESLRSKASREAAAFWKSELLILTRKFMRGTHTLLARHDSGGPGGRGTGRVGREAVLLWDRSVPLWAVTTLEAAGGG